MTEGGEEEEGGCDVGCSGSKRFVDEKAGLVGGARRVGDVVPLEVTRSRGRMRGRRWIAGRARGLGLSLFTIID